MGAKLYGSLPGALCFREKYHATQKTDNSLTFPFVTILTGRLPPNGCKPYFYPSIFPMKCLSLVVLSCLALPALAQQNEAARFSRTITPGELKKKLSIIASDEMEGRETATPGQKRAAAYIENYFRGIGLQPGNNGSYQQVYPVYQDSLVQLYLKVDQAEATGQYTVSPSSLATGSWNFNKVLFAGFGLTEAGNDPYFGLDVKDKWLMLLEGSAASVDSLPEAKEYKNIRAVRMKPYTAFGKGARGLLIVVNSLPETGSKGNMYLEAKSGGKPVIYITAALAARILHQQQASIKALRNLVPGVYPTNVAINETVQQLRLESSNVIGVLPGTDKKGEYVFVTGHYDHLGKRGNVIYNGADDDGSGTTSVLQIANAFAQAKKAGKGPRRTMVFMTVSGEEKGLWGSEYYSEHPIFPLDQTSVDLNIDMVGRIDPDYKGDSLNYVYAIGEDKLSSELQRITDSINTNPALEIDRRFNDPKDPNRFYFRSDHYNFARKGVPVIFYFNGVHADYHQPGDKVEKINFPLMAKRVQLVFKTAWVMANRENMLLRDKPLPQEAR